MNAMRRLIFLGLILSLAMSASSCSADESSPPSAEDIEIPELSRSDRATIDDDTAAIPGFLQASARLPATAKACEERLPTLMQASVDAREVAEELEGAELQGLLVNHSAAVWDYLRLCAQGQDATDAETELDFYQEVLEQWLRG